GRAAPGTGMVPGAARPAARPGLRAAAGGARCSGYAGRAGANGCNEYFKPAGGERRFLSLSRRFGCRGAGRVIATHVLRRARRAAEVGEAAMRNWWKKWALVAGGLLGLGVLAAPAHAQFMPPAGPGG